MFSDHVHAFEHSLEVHLPFLQRVLDPFTLVPLAVGHATPEAVAEVLDLLGGAGNADRRQLRPVALPAYATAQQVDGNTCRHILQLDTHIHPEQTCGALSDQRPVARRRRRGWKPPARAVQFRRHRRRPQPVVGYAAFAFTEGEIMAELGNILLTLARNAIASRLGQPTQPVGDSPELTPRAPPSSPSPSTASCAGCIGSLEAWPAQPGRQENALAAAFRDPRFDALGEELPFTRVEVSLLTPAEADELHWTETDALAQLRPGIDGVIFSVGNRRSTFLPQVWEQLPTRPCSWPT